MTGDQAQAAGEREYARVTGSAGMSATLTEAQRKLLAFYCRDAVKRYEEMERVLADDVDRDLAAFGGECARELAALIEVAESVVVTERTTLCRHCEEPLAHHAPGGRCFGHECHFEAGGA